jgi:hypothetical protein
LLFLSLYFALSLSLFLSLSGGAVVVAATTIDGIEGGSVVVAAITTVDGRAVVAVTF